MKNGKNILAWLPAVASVAAVIGSLCFTISRQMRNAEAVDHVRRLGANLTEVAGRAMSGILSPQEAHAIETHRADLEQRFADAVKPALLQSQLVDAASAEGLVVREIQPISSGSPKPTNPKDKKEAQVFPTYRVLIDGDYRKVASYMDKCRGLRLPARVTSLHMGTATDPQGKATEIIRAELILEIFQPANEDSKVTAMTEAPRP
jgi:hypothetical protein